MLLVYDRLANGVEELLQSIDNVRDKPMMTESKSNNESEMTISDAPVTSSATGTDTRNSGRRTSEPSRS